MESNSNTPSAPGFTFNQPEALFLDKQNGHRGINLESTEEDLEIYQRKNIGSGIRWDDYDGDNDNEIKVWRSY